MRKRDRRKEDRRDELMVSVLNLLTAILTALTAILNILLIAKD